MQWAKKQKGFTIVELLIVIVVIAILAAITIVGYGLIVKNAKSLGVANSLTNAANSMKVALLNNSSQATLPSDVKADNDIVVQLANSATTGEFCINAYRISSWEVGSYDSQSGQMRSYLCPGALLGSPVGGSVPNPPLSTNLVAPDFSTWTLAGGATYDPNAQELTFSGASGSATSPLVRLGGAATNAYLSYELYSTTASVTFSPKAGAYSGSAYFAADGTTPVMNSINYTTNGDARAIPLSAWTPYAWTIAAGPNVQYVRFTINLSPSNYTSNNFKVRNPSIQRK